MVKWWFGLVIKASWMDESSLHSISFKKSVTIHVALSHPNQKKTSRMVFHPAIQSGLCFRFPNMKNAPKKESQQLNDFETETPFQTKRLGWKHWRHWIPSRSPGMEERGFLGFVYIHPKLNGTKSQRSPFSKLRSTRAIRYSGFLSGSVKRGSCWRFLGLRVCCWVQSFDNIGIFWTTQN